MDEKPPIILMMRNLHDFHCTLETHGQHHNGLEILGVNISSTTKSKGYRGRIRVKYGRGQTRMTTYSLGSTFSHPHTATTTPQLSTPPE
jgi:hypothetical protein